MALPGRRRRGVLPSFAIAENDRLRRHAGAAAELRGTAASIALRFAACAERDDVATVRDGAQFVVRHVGGAAHVGQRATTLGTQRAHAQPLAVWHA